MCVSEIERQMGIETYLTSITGVGGKIRRSIEDFAVEEVLVDGSTATVEKIMAKSALGASEERKLFLLCVLVKRNWDTFIAIKNIAMDLGINQARIQIAGIKDAKAITAQFVTLKGVSAEQAAKVRVKDVELRPVGYFREQLCPFYLLGNSFKINISEISNSASAVENQTTKFAEEITASGGIPNFYGHQRFGTTRAITHLVGKAMVQDNLETATMVFLSKSSVYEHPESKKARTELQATHDFKEALQNFPKQLRFERLMLRHLAEVPNDFAGAFRRLPLKLRMLFVQAWQSYLFNRFLSARMKGDLALRIAEVGDFVVGVERSGLPMARTDKVVAESNVAEINSLIEAGKLRVALPIFGTRQKLSGGKMGELERKILDEEGVEAREFRVSALPEINSKGELRAAVCPVQGFSADRVSKDSEGRLKLPVEFMLFRGSYATVLLRELIKPQNLIAAGF